MRLFIVVSLLVGVAVCSPIGQVEVTTTLPQDLARNDLELNDATTVVVEVLADEATTVASDRARQAPPAPAAGGEDESNEDGEEEEATTANSSGGGGSVSSSGGRPRPPPAIPQPFANSSNFLAEYEFSSQFNLGPKDEKLPLAVVPGQAQPAVAEQVPQIGTPQSAAAPAEQAAPTVPASSAAPAAPTAPAASEAAPAAPVSSVAPAVPSTLSGDAAPAVPSVPATGSTSSVPSIVAAGEDEDDAESEEDVQTQTEAPTARLQQQQQQQPASTNVVDESDSDNEITNDDVTTIKSFVREYEETIQKLGTKRTEGQTQEVDGFPTTKMASPSLLVPLSQRLEQSPLYAESNPAFNYSAFGLSRVQDDDRDPDVGPVLADGELRAACECGKLPFRVPIGSEAEINLRPWTVAIVRGGLIAGGRPHCSAVLINDRYVLSSASCMEGLHPNGIQVWLTAHNTLYNHHLNVGTSKINVQEVIVHPNYRRGSHENDISLIKLSQPVDISTSSSYFTPICLPSATHVDYAGRYGMIFGWGYGRVNRICTADVPILENSVCKRDTRHGSRVTDNMMCAGFLTPLAPVRTQDCIGDAGGPLSIQLNGRVSLIGITSWGFEHYNRGHTPTVYTRVSGYADWILHNTEDADWCVG